jgi:hypothetical protein
LLKLLFLDDEKLVLTHRVAAPAIQRLHNLSGADIDELVPEPVASLAVYLAEADPLRSRDRGVECDRAGDQRKLQIAFPMRSRGHDRLQLKNARLESNSCSESIF